MANTPFNHVERKSTNAVHDMLPHHLLSNVDDEKEQQRYETRYTDSETSLIDDWKSTSTENRESSVAVRFITSSVHKWRRRRAAWLVVGLVMLMGLVYTGSHYKNLDDIPLPLTFKTSALSPPDRVAKVHLILPLSNINENACKVILAGTVLGYPSPTLVNWNTTYHEAGLIANGSHLAKVTGVLAHLQTFGPEHDDDLVIMLDAMDTWFQLRPSVLVERYLELTKRADLRVSEELGAAAMEAYDIKHKVIFSSQKFCWPGLASNPSCAAVPQSALPKHIYGDATDVVLFGNTESNPHRWVRNRWLNSGSAIGAVSALRAILERANEYIHDSNHFYRGSDQGLFADVWGEQEFWRGKYVASQYAGRGNKVPSYKDLKLKESKNYEFGMLVDTENLITITTVHSGHDTAWLTYNDHDAITAINKEFGLDHDHIGTIPKDIARSQLPFSALSSDKIVTETGWSDVPLFVNVRTGFTSVVIHHAEWREGMKNRMQTMWNETWFQPYARSLLDVVRAQRLEDVPPLARFNVEGETWEWRSAERGASRGVVTTDTGLEMSFEEVCGEYWEELFRDQADEAAS